MFRKLFAFSRLALMLAVCMSSFASPNPSRTTQSLSSPFFFTENKGQWDSRVLYKCQAKNGMTWFLERDGITLLVSKEDRTKEAIVDPFERDLPDMLRRHPARYPMKSHALKFHFVKGEWSKVNGERSTKNDSENLDQSFSTLHPSPYTLHQSFSTLHPTPYTLHRTEAQSIEALDELSWKNNYFLGNDSSRWAPNCRNFSSVIYREVWDGIDIEWYENDGKLEFDFIVHPGFDPSQIRMSIEGLEGDRISGFGDQKSELSLRGSAATKQSHLDNGNREPETGNSRGVPRTPAGNVRDLLRDSRTTGGTSLSLRGMERRIVSREADSRSEMTKQYHLDNWNRESGTGDSRGVPRTPSGNVRAQLRDSRTTGGTVHRTFLSDGVKDSSRDRRPCLSDDNVRDMVPESRTTVGKSFTNSTDK
ncbi:MAG: hypothetical protein OEM52_10500, partial [bacterium]|nr:hypothetical protein [bacterium]